MPALTPEKRKEFEQRLASIKKQIESLHRAAAAGEDVAVHIYVLEREQTLREQQLKLGRA